MRCRFCGVDDDKVIDSRSVNQGFSIRRRRVCSKCGPSIYDLRTAGRADQSDQERHVAGEVRSGQDRRGLELAFKKRRCRRRRWFKLSTDIEADVMTRDAQEVTTELVGNLVMKHLRKIDQVAYVRFASVYRDFKDVEIS